jgi:hypothetical protein
MKQCPNCKSTYTDETLKFCLADGTNLVSLTDAEKTFAMSNDETIEMFSAKPTKPVRVNIQKDDAPESVATLISPAFSPQPQMPERKSNWAIIGVLSGLLILVLLGFAGFAAYVFLKPGSNENKNVAATSPTPQPSATTDNKKDLEEKVANLEKQIANQKNQKTANSPNPFPTEETPKERTARANSPSDGFLALRSLPSTETGERLAKIPHGTRLTVIDCPKPTNPGKIKGSWCRVIYNGQEGWAFDAYMIFE